MRKVGFYCWAGPGTIRMLELKFFNPRIDYKSLMQSYDYDYLARIQDTFGVTDVWATYSWGFNPKTEKEDYNFLLSKLNNFKKLGIQVHAYMQGTNLVYSEFPDVDWFCEDEHGRPVTYYRGRRVTCVNNPGFTQFVNKKIEKLVDLGFDGMFMDNVVMGQMPVPIFKNKLPFVFAGCRCIYCLKKFSEETGETIPVNLERNPDITKEYLNFRVKSLTNFIEGNSKLVRSKKMQFGTNSYDPLFNTDFVFGFNIKNLQNSQDYILFENHSFPNPKKRLGNEYIDVLSKTMKKPVFCVSYKKGIGQDSEYSQDDFNNLYSEEFSFSHCLKGSEYLTNGVWHNLRIEKYTRPEISKSPKQKQVEKQRARLTAQLLKHRPVKSLVKRLYNPMFTAYMEKRRLRRILDRFYMLAVSSHG